MTEWVTYTVSIWQNESLEQWLYDRMSHLNSENMTEWVTLTVTEWTTLTVTIWQNESLEQWKYDRVSHFNSDRVSHFNSDLWLSEPL